MNERKGVLFWNLRDLNVRFEQVARTLIDLEELSVR